MIAGKITHIHQSENQETRNQVALELHHLEAPGHQQLLVGEERVAMVVVLNLETELLVMEMVAIRYDAVFFTLGEP